MQRWNSGELRQFLLIIYLGLTGIAGIVALLIPPYALRAGVLFVVGAAFWTAVYWAMCRIVAPSEPGDGWLEILLRSQGLLATLYCAFVAWGIAEARAAGRIPESRWWFVAAWAVGFIVVVVILPAALAATKSAADTLDPNWGPPSQAVLREEPWTPWRGIAARIRAMREREPIDDTPGVPPRQPALRVDLTTANDAGNPRMELGVVTPLPVDVWERVAAAVLGAYGDPPEPLSQTALERRGVLSDSQWREMIAWMEERGLARYKDPRSPKQGRELTRGGELFLGTVLDHTAPPLVLASDAIAEAA